ncbi:MAG: Uma2 family endonuclease [Candidatus Promineofilum sp.]|nr:Uma2 family endonuclease [Promineifilum sp.]MCW5863110.1 Uma2 family endonuclease [Anaerolineae bacterium]
MERQVTSTARKRRAKAGEPVWELARLFPSQGSWSEEAYLALDTGRLIEYSEGFLEFPPMPTMAHQDILIFLFELLKAYVLKHQLGKVYVAPLPVRLRAGRYREPDVFFVSTQRVHEAEGKYPSGADLVMEIVSGSPSDRERDLVQKRHDYAQAGIPEYWIVDPDEGAITVLWLEGEAYVEHGRFAGGETATSRLLPGFAVAVAAVWAAAQ